MDLPLRAMSSKIWRRPRWSGLIVSFFAWHWFSHPQQMKLPLCWWSKDSISSISILLTFDFWLGMQEIPQGRNRTQVTPNVPSFLLQSRVALVSKKSECSDGRSPNASVRGSDPALTWTNFLSISWDQIFWSYLLFKKVEWPFSFYCLHDWFTARHCSQEGRIR